MLYGIIKSLFPERGFGFIDQGGRQDVYFHAAEIGNDIFQLLRPDQAVKFELAKRKRDEDSPQKQTPRAARVELIDRLPGGILATNEHAPRHHPKARQRKATWKRRIDVRKNEGS